jgi:hypothetical protein
MRDVAMDAGSGSWRPDIRAQIAAVRPNSNDIGSAPRYFMTMES